MHPLFIWLLSDLFSVAASGPKSRRQNKYTIPLHRLSSGKKYFPALFCFLFFLGKFLSLRPESDSPIVLKIFENPLGVPNSEAGGQGRYYPFKISMHRSIERPRFPFPPFHAPKSALSVGQRNVSTQPETRLVGSRHPCTA